MSLIGGGGGFGMLSGTPMFPMTPHSQAHQALIDLQQLSLLGGQNNGFRQANPAFYSGPIGASGLANAGAAQALAFVGAGREPVRDIPNEGIRAGEVLAWRVWRVKDDLLRSFTMDDIWAPGEPMTGDPTDGIGGIHAFKTASRAYSLASDYSSPLNTHVVGRIAMWGAIVEYEHGYHAENAAVASLDALFGCQPSFSLFWRRQQRRRLQHLREFYGVAAPTTKRTGE